MNIGITGHQRIAKPTHWSWVERELNQILSNLPGPITGVTSLAIGADQLFAEVVLQHQGTLITIVPFPSYELTFAEGGDRQRYKDLLAQASTAHTLPHLASDEASYFEAGKQVVDTSDMLIAVWDGKPPRGLGGTGDIVKYATQQGKKIFHLNPDVCQVTEIAVTS